MIYLSIRTDKPESEIAIFKDGTSLSNYRWEANRRLAETIHKTLEQQLEKQGLGYKDLNGVIVFKGPGSFTGLRIGASVINALASSLNLPVVACGGSNWIEDGIERLNNGENDKLIIPEYGSLPNVTKQKK